MSEKEPIYFTTGNTLLDLVTGGAKDVFGLPAGKFFNLVGDSSSGKSLICTEIVAANHYKLGKKFKWVYDDCESGYSFNTSDLYGFDIMGDNPVQSETVEEAFVNIANFAKSLKKDECGIYILDSLDGLTSDEQDEQAEGRIKAYNAGKDYDKGTYGVGKQKYLSREFFPQLSSLIKEKNVLVIIVSQVRGNLDPFSFEKFRRSGGKALDFYCFEVMWLASIKKTEKKDRVVGVTIKAKLTKGKIGRPFRECVVSMLFDYGVDNLGSNIDYLFDLRTPGGELSTKAKAIDWEGGATPSKMELKKWLKAHDVDTKGIDDYISYIKEDKELSTMWTKEHGATMTRSELIEYVESKGLEETLVSRVREKWESAENEIRSNRKKRYGGV